MPQALGAANQPITEATAIPNGDNSGVATLIAGVVTILFPDLTASSRIFATCKTPRVTTLTTNYIARDTGRIVGTSFTLEAVVAAGTINVADLSDLDWYVIP